MTDVVDEKYKPTKARQKRIDFNRSVLKASAALSKQLGDSE